MIIGIKRTVNLPLGFCEDKLPAKNIQLEKLRPIFILGPPRCGSTLLYQILTSSIDIGYPSNRHHTFYGAPGFAEKYLISRGDYKNTTYRSHFGRTQQPDEPSEFSDWWYRFFPKEPGILNGIIDANSRTFRKSVKNLAASFQRPVLYKNLYAVGRIHPLLKALPEALFLVVRRDEIDTAHSILEARMLTLGNYESWFSFKPPNFDQISRLPPHQQVILQIRSIYREIESVLYNTETHHPSDRVFEVHYKDYCDNPLKTVDEFMKFIALKGFHLKRTRSLPEKFPIRSEIRIDLDLYEELIKFSTNVPVSRNGKSINKSENYSDFQQ